MTQSKRQVESIDESLLLSSICETTSPSTVEPKAEQSTRREQNTSTNSYSTVFLQKNELKSRQCVYISQDIHTTIAEIVRVIASKDVTVGGYIDKVLSKHLETHKEEINQLYKKGRKDLIE